VCVCVSLCVLLLFFSDCRIYLFSSLAARVFNKLTRYSLLEAQGQGQDQGLASAGGAKDQGQGRKTYMNWKL